MGIEDQVQVIVQAFACMEDKRRRRGKRRRERWRWMVGGVCSSTAESAAVGHGQVSWKEVQKRQQIGLELDTKLV